jgi:hypothetical protein
MGVFQRRTIVLRVVGVLSVAAAMGFSLPADAQTSLLIPPTPLLPQHFGPWQMQDQATTGDDPNQIDAAHAIPLKEDGFSRFSTAPFKRGAATIEVKVLQFMDATGATAALSLYRAGDAKLRPLPAGVKLGTESVASEGQILFRTGNSLVIAAAPRVQPSELQALAYTLPKISGPKGMSPLLPTLLPVKGLEASSVRYALGPVSYAATGGILPPEILGFEKSAESVTASYVGRSGKETLTLLLYPTPQIAGDRGRAVEAWVNTHSSGLGTVKMRREGPLVLMTAGALPSEEAQQMIENIHLRNQVTWDKKIAPEFHTEVRKTASLLYSILVFSGLLMLAAILLGLFLGGGRAAYRVMRGKSAATEPEFLGLGLERGPVKAVERSDEPAR